MRIIPTSMATQHPDNANAPYWQQSAFVSTAAELKEAYLCFSDLDIDEYNWDWEGKFVDEAVVDRLLHKHFEYFAQHPLGKEKFLTFRLPNPRVEKQFRLARAFMVVVTSSQLAQSLGVREPPIFETILPLTESATEVIELQKAYRDLVSIDHRLLRMNDGLQHIEIIPLFEQVDTIMHSDNLLRSYISKHKDIFKRKPEYLRPYCARSDPALNSGLVPTMLALRVAFSSYREVERETGVKLFPMVGTGSLPFRGGVTPENVEYIVKSYAGVSTLTVQSAFRYDYPKKTVQQAIEELRTKLPKQKAVPVTEQDRGMIAEAIALFEQPYRHTIEQLAPLINRISRDVPRRRERVQHIGIFGYSRGVGSVSLPRAIPFTASLYSLGIPPELIGTGYGLKTLKRSGMLTDILRHYPNIKTDIQNAGYFLNKNIVAKLEKKGIVTGIIDDIAAIESALGIELGPHEQTHDEHGELATKVYTKADDTSFDLSRFIAHGGRLRKSLG